MNLRCSLGLHDYRFVEDVDHWYCCGQDVPKCPTCGQSKELEPHYHGGPVPYWRLQGGSSGTIQTKG